MAKFLTGNELNHELEQILGKAEHQIILISPFIKLHDRFKSTLQTKKDNPKVKIIIVFGKNEDDISKSMKYDDFSFFKDFPNIQIRYQKHLHAKYYANESMAILTSMNLYSYSQDNNIEAGVMTKSSILGNFANNLITSEDTLDKQTWDYFYKVIVQSDLLFQKTPQYESAILGLTRKYKNSIIEEDKLSEFFADRQKFEATNRKDNFEEKKTKLRPTTQSNNKSIGYCIRTGKQIPFNTKRPFTDEAFQNWAKFGKEDYPEKFCHYSGEPSNGETTFAKPILHKNWNKAKTDHKF